MTAPEATIERWDTPEEQDFRRDFRSTQERGGYHGGDVSPVDPVFVSLCFSCNILLLSKRLTLRGLLAAADLLRIVTSRCSEVRRPRPHFPPKPYVDPNPAVDPAGPTHRCQVGAASRHGVDSLKVGNAKLG